MANLAIRSFRELRPMKETVAVNVSGRALAAARRFRVDDGLVTIPAFEGLPVHRGRCGGNRNNNEFGIGTDGADCKR